MHLIIVEGTHCSRQGVAGMRKTTARNEPLQNCWISSFVNRGKKKDHRPTQKQNNQVRYTSDNVSPAGTSSPCGGTHTIIPFTKNLLKTKKYIYFFSIFILNYFLFLLDSSRFCASVRVFSLKRSQKEKNYFLMQMARNT